MVFVVSEVYYPEEAGTAHYMTGVAQGLARSCATKVICAKPKYDGRWAGLPRDERHQGVDIHRCWATTFDKNHLVGRVANVFSSSIAIVLALHRRLRRGDRVLVVTSPPMLPFLTAAACVLRGAKCFLRVDDVYPDAMIHAGLLSKGGLAARFLDWMNRRLYRRVERVIVIGRDMRRLIEKKTGVRGETISVIPNWSDVEVVMPARRADSRLLREYALQDKFVVGYAGNIGRVQAVEVFFHAACQLQEAVDIHFLVVGSGQKSEWLRGAVAQAGLRNMTLVGQRPRGEQSDFLNACDLGLVSLVRGMAGVGVPSRLYNVMAAGKPVLAVIDEDSESAMVVREEGIGWVVSPDDPGGVARAILEARSDRERLARMGRRAREVAETKYSRERVVREYERLVLDGCV